MFSNEETTNPYTGQENASYSPPPDEGIIPPAQAAQQNVPTPDTQGQGAQYAETGAAAAPQQQYAQPAPVQYDPATQMQPEMQAPQAPQPVYQEQPQQTYQQESVPQYYPDQTQGQPDPNFQQTVPSPDMQGQYSPQMPSQPPVQIPPTRKADPADVAANKLFAFLGCVPLVCLFPLITKKDSPFVQFYAKQGVVLTIMVFGLMIFAGLVWTFSWRLMTFVQSVTGLVTLIYVILGILHVQNGNLEKLPFIGQYADKINI